MNVDVKSASGLVSMVTEPPEIKSVGIIGAGQMGNGIAHVCALAGLPVTIVDIKQEALTKAVVIMARNMERQVNRSVITSDQRDEALALVKTSAGYSVSRNDLQAEPGYHSAGRLVREFVVEVCEAQNLLVIKTATGSAQPVAAAIDSEGWAEIVGTVGGDDTILVISQSKKNAHRLSLRIKGLMQ